MVQGILAALQVTRRTYTRVRDLLGRTEFRSSRAMTDAAIVRMQEDAYRDGCRQLGSDESALALHTTLPGDVYTQAGHGAVRANTPRAYARTHKPEPEKGAGSRTDVFCGCIAFSPIAIQSQMPCSKTN